MSYRALDNRLDALHAGPCNPVRRRRLPVLMMFLAVPLGVLADGSASFNQTNWGGIKTDTPPIAPINNTGWTNYNDAHSLLAPVNSGADLFAVGPLISVEHTSDGDFAFAQDSVTRTTNSDFTTTVEGVAPVFTNVVASAGSIQLASGRTSGSYTSSLIDTYLGGASDVHYSLKNVQFSATVPSGTSISADGDPGNFLATVYLRAGSSANPGDATWTAWQEFASGFTIGSFLERRYVQFEVQLTTNNSAVTPSLDDITIGMVKFPSGTGVEVASGSVALKAGFASGTYFSKILDLTKTRELISLEYDRTVPSQSTVQLFVRASNQPSPTASPRDWTAWTQITASSPASLASLGLRRYFQYKAEIAAPGGGSPALDRVKLNYRDDPDDTPRWLSSSRFDTGSAASHIDAIYWTEDETLPAGTDVQLKLAAANEPGKISNANTGTPAAGQTYFVGPDGTYGTYWNSADDDGGGCFKRSTWVACTNIPAQLNHEPTPTNDQNFAYLLTLVPSNGNSPKVSDVVVRYGTGNRHAVTVIPTSGVVLSEVDTATPFNVGVVLHTAPASDVTITFTSGDANEVLVNGGASGSLVFTNANWSVPQDIALTSVTDNAPDGDKSITITTTAASADANYNAIGVADIAVTNQDKDKYTATIIATDENATEAGQDRGTFTVSLNANATGSTGVSFSITGTANHAGSDYTPLLASPVTVAPGTRTATLTITPVNDNLLEGDETITVTLASGANYVVGTPSSATITIFDDEVPEVPTVSISASATRAREADGTQGFFTVSRTGLKTDPLAVFFTVGGTATAVSDYTAISGSSVIIPAGSSNTVMAVKPVNDSEVEGDETVTLTLSSSANYITGSSSTATVTITDDDAAPAPSGGGGGGGVVHPLLLVVILISARHRARRQSTAGW